LIKPTLSMWLLNYSETWEFNFIASTNFTYLWFKWLMLCSMWFLIAWLAPLNLANLFFLSITWAPWCQDTFVLHFTCMVLTAKSLPTLQHFIISCQILILHYNKHSFKVHVFNLDQYQNMLDIFFTLTLLTKHAFNLNILVIYPLDHQSYSLNKFHSCRHVNTFLNRRWLVISLDHMHYRRFLILQC
jgi:hypothetical protein